MCWPSSTNHSRMCTEMNDIVPWMANSAIYDYARWDIIKRSMLEKLGMMVSLRNNHHKFGRPFLLEKLIGLNNLIQLDVQNLIEHNSLTPSLNMITCSCFLVLGKNSSKSLLSFQPISWYIFSSILKRS